MSETDMPFMSEPIRCPALIKLMLACHCYSDPSADYEGWNSEVNQKNLSWLKEMDLINDDLASTSRGRAWVDYICDTPLPQQAWVLPEREKI